jgi:deoxyribodipyrimidine photo-lyase
MSDALRFTADDLRLRRLNQAPADASGEFVLYWCMAYRRGSDNAALAYAIERANELGLPCVVYESIRPDHPYASDRLHTFALECARDTAAALAERGILHAFFLPGTASEAKGVVRKLAQRAAMVVSDDAPGSIFEAQHTAVARAIDRAYVVVDDACGVPMALFPKLEVAARTLRPKLLRVRDAWVRPLHEPRPKVAAPRVAWPFDPVDLQRADVARLVAACAIDHDVAPVEETPGGSVAAETRLARFVRDRLAGYATDRNDPSRDATTGLSAYLHWGAVSARRVALSVRAEAEDRGAKEAGDALLEQLLVRRGLAYNFAARSKDPTSYDAMPGWAKETLATHGADKRTLVSPEDLEGARSPDELWNAAQLELRARGVIHNYARMLWGKLVLPWMPSPRAAHALLIGLNDKYALDGRDPDGWANIGWCFGLHDRPWPERPVYGTVRTMTSRSARSKLDFESYLDRARGWRDAAIVAG